MNSGGVIAKTVCIPNPNVLLRLMKLADTVLASTFPYLFALQQQMALRRVSSAEPLELVMIRIAHRVNTLAQLRATPPEYGVEIDLRDRGERLILQHDPFLDGEDFADWLTGYRHRLVILNVKSERIEYRVLELVRRFGVADYFFLDCSFPMINRLANEGVRKIAVRFSEYEPVEGCLALAGRIDWVWVDCFTRMPLDPVSYAKLKAHFKLCAVSPELQGRPPEEIPAYAARLQPFLVDAVCTKHPNLWGSGAEVPGGL